MNSTMQLGDNVKVLAWDESHAILEVKDDTGELTQIGRASCRERV